MKIKAKAYKDFATGDLIIVIEDGIIIKNQKITEIFIGEEVIYYQSKYLNNKLTLHRLQSSLEDNE